jgi:hypothetical protein
MLMAEILMAELRCKTHELDHRNFQQARSLIESKGDYYAHTAIERIQLALKLLYGDAEVSLQRLAATFRRGDLHEHLSILHLI